MQIVFFSHYYAPEGNAPASRTAEHCQRWAQGDEHRVTVITCAPNVPDGRVYSGYRNRFRPTREVIDGVEVIRVWTWIQPGGGKLSLMLNYLSYLVTALLTFFFVVRRPDVIIATTPQFFCGIAGVVAGKLRRVPTVLEVRDIWPESIVTVGAMKRGWMIRVLEKLERWMYRHATHLVAVGPGYRENILEKVDVRDRISMVTNGVDPAQFAPVADDGELRKRYDLGERLVCSYTGTIGRAHGLEIVVRAAQRLQDSQAEQIAFLIVGGGANRDHLRQAVIEAGVQDRVVLTGRLDKSQMPAVLAASDVCLVHLSKVDLFEHVIPSKIFETMAMEKPIIMGVKGRAREIVLQAEAGVPLEPENDEELANLLDQFFDNPEGLVEMGKRGRGFVKEYFDRDLLASDLLQILERVCRREVFCFPDRVWDQQDSWKATAGEDREQEATTGEQSSAVNAATTNDRSAVNDSSIS